MVQITVPVGVGYVLLGKYKKYERERCKIKFVAKIWMEWESIKVSKEDLVGPGELHNN